MATPTGIELLSALRRSGATSAIREIPESFFVEDDERAAFVFMRNHVLEYRTYPNPGLFFRQTGLRTIEVTQPLSYYVNEARKRALYNVLTSNFGSMRDALEAMNPDGIVEIARQMVQASAQLGNRSTDFVTIETALQSVLSDFRMAQATSGLRGITSGWRYVDEQTDGWQNDDLISIVGRIGIGKTYVMLYMAYHAWLAGYSVLFNTNELGATQLARRLFGLHTKINPNLIRRGRLSTAVASSLDEQASGMLRGIPFNLIVGGLKKSVQTISAVAEATTPDIVFSDAAYLLESEKKRKGGDSRRETVSDTMEDLKRFTIDHSRPLVASVQFNRKAEFVRTRDHNTNTNPTTHLSLSKIGETDVIGQVSSVVIGLAKAFAPHAETRRWGVFLKGREGESGVFQFNYQHQPVNFDIISVGDNSGVQAERPDLSHMV